MGLSRYRRIFHRCQESPDIEYGSSTDVRGLEIQRRGYSIDVEGLHICRKDVPQITGVSGYKEGIFHR